MSDYTQFPCKPGDVCEAGKSGYTHDMLCPEGPYCLSKTQSIDEALSNLRPPGRYCSSKTETEIDAVQICKKIKLSNFLYLL